MAFDITAAHNVVSDACGNMLYEQGGVYYFPYYPYVQTTLEYCNPDISGNGIFPIIGGGRISAIGDSMVSNCNRGAVITSAENAAGILTVTVANHQGYNQFPFYLTGANEDAYNSSVFTMGSGTTTGVVNNTPFSNTAISPATGTITLWNLCQGSDYDWLGWVCGLSRGAFNRGYTLGWPGKETAYVLGKAGLIVTEAPKICVVLVGTNDISAGTSPATIRANLKSIWDFLLAAGIIPVACTLPPINNTVASWAASWGYNILRTNELIRKEIAGRTDIVLADLYATLVDPLNATSNYKSGYTLDGKHPVGVGVYAIATAIYNALNTAGLVPTSTKRLAMSVDESYGTDSSIPQIHDNPLGTGTAGTVTAPATGTALTGWTLARLGGATVTGSTPARADGFGNDQQIVITSAADGDGATFTGTNYSGRVSAGYAQAFVEVDIASATLMKRLSFYIQAVSGGVTSYPGVFASSSSTLDNTNKTVVFATPAIPIPAATNIQAFFNIQFSGVGGATIKLGRMTIHTWS